VPTQKKLDQTDDRHDGGASSGYRCVSPHARRVSPRYLVANSLTVVHRIAASEFIQLLVI
jgi:hypothetical protein